MKQSTGHTTAGLRPNWNTVDQSGSGTGRETDVDFAASINTTFPDVDVVRTPVNE
ncbi:hypothetical protein GCM10008985_16290 [Halococcus dombrowskii]|uniref:Uncharacterized protein n=1 Tax=Halococcus dombrowskii TaxID=179637 RepID=A0AAV3SGK1_HALDO